MLQFRKLLAIACALCLLLTCFAGCGKQEEEPETTEATQAAATQPTDPPAPTEPEEPVNYTGRIAALSLDEDGYYQISREAAKNEPMGDPNTWTIFVYLCGSDLERDGAAASYDLQEMVDGSENSKVRYVVMTGGTPEWQNTVVGSENLEYYLVQNGEIEFIQSTDYQYMNDPDTLLSFLRWGVENYPASKMGLVMWDHGGGSLSGVCVDQVYFDDIESGVLDDLTGYNDTLTLPDISHVLDQVYAEMTDQFEFIGFDACLMGTMESAFMLSSYARYMYASPELEPGCGWDYVAMGRAIGPTGRTNGAELGKAVCDGFYKGCKEAGQDSFCTLLCVDLTKVDDLAYAVDALAMDMLAASEDPAALASIVQSVNKVEYFGGNSDSEGHYNLIDMGSFAQALSGQFDRAGYVLEALKDAIVCYRSGIDHENAWGLSIYYPLYIIPGSADLGKFAKVAVGPYYYGFAAENAYAAANGGIEGYDFAESLSAWATAADDEIEDVVEDYGDPEVTGESPYIVFCDEPALYEDGTYGFSLEDDSLPYVSTVEADIYFLDEDNWVYLGSTNDIIADWDQGVFLDNFDGMWFCTPENQLVCAYVVSETEEFTIYTTPVLLKDEETNLRFTVNNSDYTVTLEGVWTSIEETGVAGRNSVKLNVGDSIIPIFKAINADTGEIITYYGEEYIYDGSNTWYYTTLFDAEFLYRFCIYDIYGDYYTTDGATFTVEDGEIFFTVEE